MLFGADQEDTNSIVPTDFDLARIDALSIGEKCEGECGNFSVLKYKEKYVLLLNNHPTKNNYQEFKNLDDLIMFLKKN